MSEQAKADSNKTRGSKKNPDAPKASLNLDEIRALAELVDTHGFTDFEYENENIRVRLSKQTAVAVQPAQVAVAAAPVPVAVAPVSESQSTAASAEKADPDADLVKVTSPIVGTFYRSPGPDKDAYVKEGDKVSESSVVCIVEAMKLMNEIQAEVSGEIVRIYVDNGQPVEFGQPLFGIRK